MSKKQLEKHNISLTKIPLKYTGYWLLVILVQNSLSLSQATFRNELYFPKNSLSAQFTFP